MQIWELTLVLTFTIYTLTRTLMGEFFGRPLVIWHSASSSSGVMGYIRKEPWNEVQLWFNLKSTMFSIHVITVSIKEPYNSLILPYICPYISYFRPHLHPPHLICLCKLEIYATSPQIDCNRFPTQTCTTGKPNTKTKRQDYIKLWIIEIFFHKTYLKWFYK